MDLDIAIKFHKSFEALGRTRREVASVTLMELAHGNSNAVTEEDIA